MKVKSMIDYKCVILKFACSPNISLFDRGLPVSQFFSLYFQSCVIRYIGWSKILFFSFIPIADINRLIVIGEDIVHMSLYLMTDVCFLFRWKNRNKSDLRHLVQDIKNMKFRHMKNHIALKL